jgi:predicted dehydrogenase
MLKTWNRSGKFKLNNKISISILSFAHGHASTYCQEIQSYADARLVSAWDDDPERGRTEAAKYGMQFCPNIETVLQDPGVDAVIVSCETNHHADLIEQAAAAGKHILCQKPLATTLADCDRVLTAIQRTGVKFSMAYQMRHDPVNQKIKALLDEGAVGRVAIVRRRHAINVLLNPDFVLGKTRWHMDPEANIGMFFDDASHAADWFYWMLGKPVSVMAEIERILTDTPSDDNGVAVFRFAGGEIGILLNSSTTVAGVNTTEIYGDQGFLVQDYGDAPSVASPHPKDAIPLRMIRSGDAAWTEFPIPIPHNQAERIRAVPRPFINYLKGDVPPSATAEDGRVVVEMLLGAYRSAKEGRRVLFPLDT